MKEWWESGGVVPMRGKFPRFFSNVEVNEVYWCCKHQVALIEYSVSKRAL